MASPGSAAEQGMWRLWFEAAGKALSRQARAEWFGSPPHLMLLARKPARDFLTFPKDLRPPRPHTGLAILSGFYDLAGRVMMIGPAGDPWDRTNPSRAFAVELHKFSWLPHLLAAGDAGVREALRLVGDWSRIYGRWNSFSWSSEILERRVFNLACAMGALAAQASDAEVEALAVLLARQTRQLLQCPEPERRAAERAVAAGVAAAALGEPAGGQLLAQTLERINRVLPEAVLPDGGHASRSAEAALELLFDLLALDGGWAQRGLEAPQEAARAIDRLTAALRFFTLADGRLGRFQGGEDSEPAYIAAARAHDDAYAAPPPVHAPAARGGWSVSACAQAGAIEVVCGGDRLITNSGWSPRAPEAQALRLTDGGSTAALGHDSAGALLGGWRARTLGPRLIGGPGQVDVRRTDAQTGTWLDLKHDGWAKTFGLAHERRLYLDPAANELRGEDSFIPVSPTPSRVIPYTIHFHVPPDVEAVVARDNKSVLLRGRSHVGWWLRNDSVEVRIEPAVHFHEGRQLTSHQVVLMGHIRADKGGRVRWKLTAVE